MLFRMGARHLSLRLGLLVSLSGIMAWLFLAPDPLPFGISVQRELGFVGHVIVFTIGSLACAAVFPCALRRVVATLLVAAACLEIAQLFIPTRGAEFADFAMNCIGILLGLVAFRIGAALAKDPHRTTSKT